MGSCHKERTQWDATLASDQQAWAPNRTRISPHVASLRRRLARRSLKPQLNQIRTWVRQGRTDAWIAHQLEVSVGDIRGFKREHGLAPAEAGEDVEATGAATELDDLDLRAEDEALVAAALEAEQEAAAEAEEEEDAPEADADEDAEAEEKKSRRRGRRGGRGRRKVAGGKSQGLEGTFDHGDEGYGLWLDPAVQDDPIYAEHWAGHRPVVVTVETDRIVIVRSEPSSSDSDDD